MRDALYLAFRSLWWFRGRAATVAVCLGLTLWLPVTVRLLLSQFTADILDRAQATPLIIGAPGSRIDLALHALYFDSAVPIETTMAEVDYVRETGFAEPIPLHIRYRTQSVQDQPGVPIVGTSVEYFEFRGLQLAQGSSLTLLGDCVLGAGVAERMQLGPGDQILSAPLNAFDLAGNYPLKMNIRGVLARSHSSDDDVVFVDLRTAWIIDGIGHGHQQLTQHTEDSLLLDKTQQTATASAAVLPFTEITADNIDSFHFHGDEATFPVTALIALPSDRKNQTLLLGRYAAVRKSDAQCLKPTEVVQELLSIVFRIERLVWLSAVLSAVVTAMFLALVLSLSVRLRAAEIQTMFKLGCGRGTIARLLGTELALMLLAGLLLALAAAWLTSLVAADSLRMILF